MILFHDVSSFFIDHLWIECSAAMTIWKNAINIRFRFSAACDKMDASASRFHFQQPGSILQATGAKQSVKTDLLYIAEDWYWTPFLSINTSLYHTRNALADTFQLWGHSTCREIVMVLHDITCEYMILSSPVFTRDMIRHFIHRAV